MNGLKKNMKENKINILIIDDSKLDCMLLADIVKKMKFTPIITHSPAEGIKIIKEKPIDLVLLDVVMEGMSGYDFLDKIFPYIKKKYLPVIFVTGLDSVEYLIEGLEKGAIDYIKKPFAPEELMARIRAALRSKGLYDELVMLNKKLKDMVMKDSLTGLLNHKHIILKLGEQFLYNKEHGTTSLYLMVDIDKFKSINDTYGHLIGDEVLKMLSRIFTDNLKHKGYAGRYGGEEFALILKDVNEESGIKFAKRLINKIRRLTMYSGTDKGIKLHITVSIGLTFFPDQYKDFSEVLKTADEALYKAKEWGRDRIVLYRNGGFEEV